MTRLQCFAVRIRCAAVAQLSRRAYSTALSRQTIELSRSGGHKQSLSVYEPRKKSSIDQPRSILLYFPRGPLLPDSEAELATRDLLLDRLPTAHVVEVGYNASEHPQPVHNAVAAFDWTVEHLVPDHSVTRGGRSQHSARIATCGELYGANLALMLALTECKIGQAGICAAAVNNPIMDWTDLDTAIFTRGLKRAATTEGFSLDTELQHAKDVLFKDERAMLDPFASPMFFFRSSGITPLSSQATQIDVEHDDDSEAHDFMPTSLQESLNGKPLERRRGPRYSHQFPSKSLRLSLPALKVSTGLLEPFRRQGLELVKQMESSYTRQSRTAEKEAKQLDPDWTYDHDLENEHERQALTDLRSSKLSYTASVGLSLWDSSPDGKASLTRTADWLKEHLTNA